MFFFRIIMRFVCDHAVLIHSHLLILLMIPVNKPYICGSAALFFCKLMRWSCQGSTQPRQLTYAHTNTHSRQIQRKSERALPRHVFSSPLPSRDSTKFILETLRFANFPNFVKSDRKRFASFHEEKSYTIKGKTFAKVKSRRVADIPTVLSRWDLPFIFSSYGQQV